MTHPAPVSDTAPRATAPASDTAPRLPKENSTNSIHFTQRLRAWAQVNGLSAPLLAQALGLSPSTFKTYYYGTRPLPLIYLQRLAQLYPINLHWLLTGQALPPKPTPGRVTKTTRWLPGGKTGAKVQRPATPGPVGVKRPARRGARPNGGG